MEAVDFRGALLRRWWLLVVIGIVGALLGVVLQPGHAKASTSQKWTTIATVGIAPQITVSRGIGVNTTATVQEIVFYAHEASVISAAAQVAGIKEPVSQLESAVIIYGPTKGTQGEVALGTVADSPSESAAFSNAVVAQLGIYLDNLAKSSQQLALAAAQQKVALLEKSISGSPKASANLSAQLSAALAQVQELSGPPQTGYSVLQPASAATAVAEGTKSSGIKSSPLTAGAIGFVLGLLVGAAIVIQMAMFDKGLRTAKRAENAFGFRVIAEIPAPQPVGPDGTDHSKSDPAMSAYLEAYRKLCMSVFLGELPLRAPEQESGYGFLEVRHGPESSSPGNGGSSISSLRPGDQALMKGRQVVLVASAGPDPSRSIVVKELAAACAGAGLHVVVMSTIGLPSEVGDGSPLDPRGDITPDDLRRHLQSSRLHGVALLPLGQLISSVGQLFTRGAKVLTASRELADVVIVEVPPLLAFHDGEALSRASDIVLLVGECGTTTFDQAKGAGEILRRSGAPVLGVILTNAVPAHRGKGKSEPYRGSQPVATRTNGLAAEPGPIGVGSPGASSRS